jgi:hypothetical protein
MKYFIARSSYGQGNQANLNRRILVMQLALLDASDLGWAGEDHRDRWPKI